MQIGRPRLWSTDRPRFPASTAEHPLTTQPTRLQPSAAVAMALEAAMTIASQIRAIRSQLEAIVAFAKANDRTRLPIRALLRDSLVEIERPDHRQQSRGGA
jgi:hypothetical protein